MTQTNAFYITTPIYYVNDAPHLGHAYTTVAADVITRYHVLKGHSTYFLTGTDEHGQKVLEAAVARGVSPQQHVDELSEPYKALWKRLGIQYSDFIRTTEPRHTQVVQSILQRLYDAGEIYDDTYEGWYSKSEERFWTEKDLVDGKCPMSGNPVEWISEKNYFFRMDKYAPRFAEWLENHPDFIQPQSRRNEVLGAMKKGVGPLCITRPKSRLPWGIEIPWDNDYVTYVWFDALINYISAIGYESDPDKFSRYWPASFHLVGKDILTTHSIYWSTMLFAMGLEPAQCLYAHGWWTVEGRKMSKSVGNVVSPNLLIDAYGADAVRYFLMREIAFGADGDFVHHGFLLRYNAELANDLGNLVHRSLSMTSKWLGGVVPPLGDLSEGDQELAALAQRVVQDFDTALCALQYKTAVGHLLELVGAANKYIDTQEPWALNREGKTERLATVMRLVLETCRISGCLLMPFCPDKSTELLCRLGAEPPLLSDEHLPTVAGLDQLPDGGTLVVGQPLFPRLSELPADIQAALEAMQASENASANPDPSPPNRSATPENGNEEMQMIEFDDFTKIELRSGKIIEAETHPNADRLLVLKVDVGEPEPRTIVAGIANAYAPTDLVGKTVVVVINLKPAKLRGIVSEGMLLAAGGSNVKGLVTVDPIVEPGEVVR